MIIKIIKKVGKNLSMEALLRLSTRLTADIVFYSMTRLKDPRVVVEVTGAAKAIKRSEVVAKKYKRKNLDPTSIFEDSIDTVTDAFFLTQLY
jgi:hypothetical protein